MIQPPLNIKQTCVPPPRMCRPIKFRQRISKPLPFQPTHGRTLLTFIQISQDNHGNVSLRITHKIVQFRFPITLRPNITAHTKLPLIINRGFK